ncbi:MAG TPA: hypothetical protein VF146_16795, partial [Bryobacteraceae bacterium]
DGRDPGTVRPVCAALAAGNNNTESIGGRNRKQFTVDRDIAGALRLRLFEGNEYSPTCLVKLTIQFSTHVP